MKIGFYECDVTPPLGCFMPGYGEDVRAEDVTDRLYVKSAVLENDGEYAVIIAVDACFVPDAISDVVTKRILKYTGINPSSVSITSTHTHKGCPISDDPIVGGYSDAPYKDVFYRLVADSAILAFKRLKEGKLKFGKAEIDGVANCRDFILEDGSYKTWAYGEGIKTLSEPDKELPMLFAEIDGKMAGVIYSFACHQDSVLENRYAYSGDYSSQVSERLKEKFGRNFVSIYLPGACGDINDIDSFGDDPDNRLGHRKIGDMIAKAIYGQEELYEIEGKLKSVKETIKIDVRKYSDEQAREILSKYISNNESFLRVNWFTYFKASNNREYADMVVQLISIGDLAIYIYPGEMYVDYSHKTKKKSPFKYNMVIENSNVFGGYIPTLKAFDKCSDLYEASPASTSFLAPEAGDMLSDKAIEIAEKARK